jgi:hypothetical protein
LKPKTLLLRQELVFLTASSKILRKFEYTSLLFSESKTRSSQFVVFSSSASKSFIKLKLQTIQIIGKNLEKSGIKLLI